MAAANSVQLQVEGMTCASCVARVEKALLKVPGVATATVNLATERATVTAEGVGFDSLKAAIEKAGYSASAASEAGAAPGTPRRFGDSGAAVVLAGLLLLPLVAPMLGLAVTRISRWTSSSGLSRQSVTSDFPDQSASFQRPLASWSSASTPAGFAPFVKRTSRTRRSTVTRW